MRVRVRHSASTAPLFQTEKGARLGDREREREIQPRRCGESLEASVEWSARVEWNRVCFFLPHLPVRAASCCIRALPLVRARD